jgi:uroporphyrin-III C-methyltransferase
MSPDALPPPLSETPSPATPAATAAMPDALRRWLIVLGAVAALALLLSVGLWQKLSSMQEQLARQTADSGAQASEARAQSRQAQELAQQTAGKLAVMDARLSEVALQRTQLEELMQSLSRSRDENLVVDIESSVRLAQQQAQLTGSVEPLMAALKSADTRLARASQPRLAVLQRAIARDIARIKGTALADTPALLIRLDELVTLADDLPVANAVGPAPVSESVRRKAEESVVSWWVRMGQQVHDELRQLVRVSRIEDPDAALLSPQQSFFLRENLKLKLLNARLGLLSRQTDAARSDLATAANSLRRYFDANSKKTQTASALLQQVQTEMRTLEIPRVDETLAALSTATAGR